MTTFYIVLQNIFNYAVKRTYFILSFLEIYFNLKHNINIAEIFPIYILFSISVFVVYFRVNLKVWRQMICLKICKEEIRGPKIHTKRQFRGKQYTMKSFYLQHVVFFL